MRETRAKLEVCISSLQGHSADLGQLTDINAEQFTLLGDVRKSLDQLLSLSRSIPYENIVLERLHFPSLYSREDDISEPSHHTFHWLVGERFETLGSHGQNTSDEDVENETLDNEQREDILAEQGRRQKISSDFMGFLAQHHGTFFITGKPGSGKSTLMSMIHFQLRSI
jgi:hypothetical protein